MRRSPIEPRSTAGPAVIWAACLVAQLAPATATPSCGSDRRVTARIVGTVSLAAMARAEPTWAYPPGPRAPEVWQIFRDPGGGRFLLEVDRAEHHITASLAWLIRGRLTPFRALKDPVLLGHLLAVDFPARRLYGLFDDGMLMSVVSFEGHFLVNGGWSGGYLHCMAVGQQAGITYRALSDVSEPDHVYVDGERDNSNLWYLRIHRVPRALLPDYPSGALYLVYVDRLETLQGGRAPAPPAGGGVAWVLRHERSGRFRGVALPGAGRYVARFGELPPPSKLPVALDVDASGRILYYGDPIARVLYKVRLEDGRVLASRSLHFRPEALAVDAASRTILVVDGARQELVSVRAF